MTAIITTQTRVFNASQIKASFEPGQPSQYLFIGKPAAWDNELIPDVPADSIKTVNDARLDMISLKRISSADVSHGTHRRNWSYGNRYDFYRDDYGQAGVQGISLDGLPTTPAGLYEANFFVINDQYDVYKCMWNNNGAPSTIQPTGYSTQEFNTADGYTWKYMFTLSANDVLKYLTKDFIPVMTLSANPGTSSPYYTQWQVQEAAISGDIRRAVVLTQGSGYTPSSALPVTIKGDGVGAVANAMTDVDGKVTSINFVTPGTGYSWAEITIPSPGTGATAKVIISPKGGHGSDPVDELGGFFIIINSVLSSDSTDFINGVDYRKIGLIRSPNIFGTTTPATAFTLAAYRKAAITTVSGAFVNGETITGSISGATATAIYHDTIASELYYGKNKGNTGVLVSGDILTGSVSGATATVSSLTDPEVDTLSGDIIYLEHRYPISHQQGQQEDIKVVLEC